MTSFANLTKYIMHSVNLNSYFHLSFQGGGAHDDLHKIHSEEEMERLMEADRLWSIVMSIHAVYLWVIAALGLPGNILALITILSMHVITPAAMLVATLAATDGLALIFKLIGHQVFRHGLHVGDTGCKCEFLVMYISTLANWVLLCICAERFIVICQPKFHNVVSTKKFWAVVLILCGVALLAIFLPISVVMRISVIKGTKCGTDDQYYWFFVNVWYWINASLHLFIPFSFVAPLTVLTVVRLYKTRGVLTGTEAENKNQAVRQMAVMLVVAALMFLLLSLPSCVYFLSYKMSDNQVVEARWAIFEQVQYMLIDSTHAVNFYLYFLSSQLFRTRLISLFCCRKSQSLDIGTSADQI
ncbi:mu-type opioid receptor-like [Physella acuta]|uniref:mu-type opioid receptor-like n=1 Tax=Physella acuta TaxID=109671 RepID=UPI0027DB3017|nr:mu-type opioid receptor-like [Physella acuta]